LLAKLNRKLGEADKTWTPLEQATPERLAQFVKIYTTILQHIQDPVQRARCQAMLQAIRKLQNGQQAS
jgi:hypothetical protein